MLSCSFQRFLQQLDTGWNILMKDYCQDWVLLASSFRSKLVGKWHLGHQPQFLPLNHGFQVNVYINIKFIAMHFLKEWFGAPNCHFKYNISSRPSPNIPVYNNDQMVGRYYEQFPIDIRTGASNFTLELVEHVLEYISREDAESPYFLYFAPDSTHAPTYSSM